MSAMDEHDDAWAVKDKIRRVFTFKHRVLVSPTVEISSSRDWAELRKRLKQALDKEFGANVAVDLNMAGRRRNNLHPTVILACSSAADERKLTALLQSWKWLHNYQFWFWVVMASELVLFAPVYARVEQMGFHRLAARHESHEMTIGGVVWLDRKPHALTAGHPFRGPDPVKQTPVESDSTKGIVPLHYPFQIQELEQLLHARPPPKLVKHAADTPLDVIPDIAPSSRPTTSSDSVIGTSVRHSWPAKPGRTFDWALIELPEAEYPTEITSVINESEFVAGEVSVVSSSGNHLGFVTSRRSLLKFGCARMTVCQITLERPLQVGDSGAWVLQNGKLCGHIIAGYTTIPWAYMMPMSRIFTDIGKKCHKTVSLTLPPASMFGFFERIVSMAKVSCIAS